MDKIKFAKVKDGAVIPSKREEDAGYDIYACFDEEYIEISPHETVKIPTGIASAFDSKYVAILKERGSTGQIGVGQRAGVFDSGFRGEWLAPITNTTNKLIVLDKRFDKVEEYKNYIHYPYNKAICQAVFLELPKLISEEVTYEELLKIKSERGNGMLGSSGK